MAFQETQKLAVGFRILVWIIIIPVVIILIREYTLTQELDVLLALVFTLGINTLLYFLLLNGSAYTRIDTQGIHYRYFPFVRNWKLIRRNDIQDVRIGNISPLTDFGGWGYRFGRKKKGLILTGDKAIFIKLNTGKELVITTSLPDHAQRELDHHLEVKTE
jgi:hypothetical protein